MKRESGVLLPVFSLPGPFGCGTIGKEAFEWIDFLSESGFSWWQILPLGITDPYFSPYSSCSSFGADPQWIDPVFLWKEGLVTKDEVDALCVKDPFICDYEWIRRTRLPFLKLAAGRFSDKTSVSDFLKENPVLRNVSRFFALRDLNENKCFRDWTIKEPDEETLFAWQFIQYEFHKQWEALHEYAASKGISILGDLPFYVSADSFDLYAYSQLFQLDQRNDPAFVAGVPPDYFSQDGQKWGNPLYNWEKMKEDHFTYWRDRMRYNLSLFDGVRIDHFRAISAYWRIPVNADTAKEGSWVKGPGKDLIDALRPLAKDKLILAEDLGIIDDDTRKLLQYSGYPGMAVLQFAFDGDPNNTHLPHMLKENTAAYTGTHDNNTLLGFCFEASEETKEEMELYLGGRDQFCEAAIRSLWMSKARLVIVPVQDLLGFGADTRINTPGKASGNWRFRITGEQMNSLNGAYWKRFNRAFGR